MTFSRRTVCLLAIGSAAVLGAARAACANAYLEDVRTARAVTLKVPRCTLAQCLAAFSKAAGIELSAGPALSRQQLVAYVPKRTVRETMSAIEELFDASWTPAGSPSSYRLDPDPVRTKVRQAARTTLLQKLRKSLDDQAVEAQRKIKTEPLPVDQTAQRDLFPPLLWSQLTPEQRLQVLGGTPVTLTIPEAKAHPAYELAVSIALKEKAPLISPLMVTFDLDDRNELALPTLRVRATGMRADSIVGAIHSLDVLKGIEIPKPAPPPGGPTLPDNIGEQGRVGGTRDELILELGEAAGLPLLSRQRAQGGTGPAVVIAGRSVSQVMADVAAACDVAITPSSRGFYLLRSRTEAFDAAGDVPDWLAKYVARRPAKGQFVSWDLLAELGDLTPLQLAVVQRSNLCTEETITAGEIYTVLRFYRTLSAEQRNAIFSPEGLDVSTLTHPQLHALLDEKVKRGNWEVHGPLQAIKGLRFRFQNTTNDGKPAVTLSAVRDGKDLEAPIVVELPQIEEEEEHPTATR